MRAFLEQPARRLRRLDRRRRRAAPGGRLVPARPTTAGSSSTRDAGRRWCANLKRDPRVALSVIDPADAVPLGRADRASSTRSSTDVERARGTTSSPSPTAIEPEAPPRPRSRRSAASRGSPSSSASPASTTTSRTDAWPSHASRSAFLLWPQTASWPALRDAAVRAERSGAASLWTWDHLNCIVGPWEGPILEGWSILAGWSQVTERATLGLMVGANTFRNPGLTAKLATTLDHLSRRPRHPRHRRGLVRARARGVRDRLRQRVRRAARPPRRVGDAPPAAARRRDRRRHDGHGVPDARRARRAAAGPGRGCRS